MKALQYLQKVGAVPETNKWDLLMSLVTMTNGLFNSSTTIEPDIIEWVQDVDSHDEFVERCDAIFYATAGDVRALFPHICNQSEKFLKELIAELLEISVFTFALIEDIPMNMEDDEWFAEVYNRMLMLKGRKGFPSRPAILQFFYSDSMVDVGQQIMSEIAGTHAEFLISVVQMQSEFQTFLGNGSKASVESARFEDEKENPFDGGYQIVVYLRLPDSDELQECTLHWAPWFTAKTTSTLEDVSTLCESFSDMQRQAWFSRLNEEG